jgi:hypothetical protein
MRRGRWLRARGAEVLVRNREHDVVGGSKWHAADFGSLNRRMSHVNRRASVEDQATPPESAPRLRARRTLELVYEVEGVGAARVWIWSGRAAVAVSAANGTASSDLLKRVEAAVVGMREAGESWEFGFLQDPAG